jgi:hypothetical protein
VVRNAHRWSVLAVSIMLAAALLVQPGPVATTTATAATSSPPESPVASRGGDNPTRTKVVKYRHNWVFRSTRLGRCAFIAVSANLVGRWRWAYRNPDGSWNHNTKNWLGFSLRDPAVHVTGWPILGAGCDSTERWRIKAQISQGWYSSGCSLEVDISVGFPWSVEANPAYQCTTNRLGHTTSIEGPSRKTLHQWNSGVPVRFEGVLAPADLGLAFSGKVLIRVHKRNASDRWTKPVNVFIK